MPQDGAFTIAADGADEGKRLDLVVASHLPGCSRSFAANLILAENVRVDGDPKKPGYRVRAGNLIHGHVPAPEPLEFKPEPIPLDILFEDEHLVVINKAPGLVVHPAPGHYSGTLVNALLYHCPDLEGIGGKLRPGIVHRLDKDTSGTLVVAKTAAAHEYLAKQFKARKIQKEYLALVFGEFDSEKGTISLPIGRHPADRKRMSTFSRKHREAETKWEIYERFKGLTLLTIHLKTGRTHQIRVHCAAINHPVVGDPVYRPRKLMKNIAKDFSGIPASIVDTLQSIKRQMLHAWQLGFTHPKTGEKMVFEAPMPEDMAEFLDKLRDHNLG
ncbi:MAG: RluA family pseudouridine synthase [Desulfobacterales bacterium]|nr:MAG: RluA family pseudouridine synthase [Desulfobacterales bacterium]